ncbi:MAG TPA: DNA oxidative demethylase AlkB [Stellaceae bacterium]|nr:DNA oxidative demethylase AlkB [Stellaceae bacterium]
MADLFAAARVVEPAGDEAIAPGAVLLHHFALPFAADIRAALGDIAAQAPFRHMTTPWGGVMSVAMTNCGEVGWLSDRAGYRYDRSDPATGRPWPAMPACFSALATSAASQACYPGFIPDACLINSYAPGTRLTLHQDRDERDYSHPIVSVSLGLPATFQFGGPNRRDLVRRFPLRHGDVVVWGNEARLAYHGIAELREGEHPFLGKRRINLTFRRAL